MLYSGQFGKTLVSDEFNARCVQAGVSAQVQAFPNPGDMTRSLRKITLTNFNATPVTVVQQNRRKQEHVIPAKGDLVIVLDAGEHLPIFKEE